MLFLLFLFYVLSSIVFSSKFYFSHLQYTTSSFSSSQLILDLRKNIKVIDTEATARRVDPIINYELNVAVLSQSKQELKGIQSINTTTPETKYNRFIHLPTTPYKNDGKTEIEFFPWNDGINYGEICNKILKRITQEDTFYVISDSIPGGIGHKYTSLLHSLTYAILTGRRFIMTTRDSFWNETNPCIRNLRYTGPLDMFQNCGRNGNKCLHVKGFDVLQSQPNENLVFRDFRPNVFTSMNLQIMHKLGLIPPNKNWDYFKRILLRLLLNPNPSNIQLIEEKRKELSSIHFHLSTHIRCAGWLSDYPEKTIMVTPQQVRNMGETFKNEFNKLHLGNTIPNVYLSTDSSKVEQYLKNKLKSIRFYSLDIVRGHSTHGDFRNLRVSLVDLYSLCISNHFLGTQASSYSRMASILCNYTSISFIPSRAQIVKSLPKNATLYDYLLSNQTIFMML